MIGVHCVRMTRSSVKHKRKRFPVANKEAQQENPEEELGLPLMVESELFLKEQVHNE